MKFLRTLIISAICCCPIALCASSSSHMEAAEKLTEIAGGKKTYDRVVEELMKIMLPDNPELKEFNKVFRKIFFKYLSYDQMKGDVAQLYVELFSEDEIQELINFYETAIGKKLLQQTPTLARRSVEFSQQRVAKALPKIQEEIREELEKIQQQQ